MRKLKTAVTAWRPGHVPVVPLLANAFIRFTPKPVAVGRILKSGAETANGRMYRARPADCRRCPRRSACVPPSAASRSILIVDTYQPLLRARRRRQKWSAAENTLYDRHRWRAEGVHSDAKTQYGLRRATRRGLANVQMQSYLTATVMNLKRLAAGCIVWTRYSIHDGSTCSNHKPRARFRFEPPSPRAQAA